MNIWFHTPPAGLSDLSPLVPGRYAPDPADASADSVVQITEAPVPNQVAVAWLVPAGLGGCTELLRSLAADDLAVAVTAARGLSPSLGEMLVGKVLRYGIEPGEPLHFGHLDDGAMG